MRVLGALVQQRPAGEGGQKRGRLVPLGASLLAAAGSLMMVRPPSGGGGPEEEDPRSWVEANRDRLPQSYEEVITHTTPYRKAILRALPAEGRSQLWVEHLNRYRATHPGLSSDQIEVIDRAVALVPRVLVEEQDLSDELQRLEEASKRAFGDEAGALIATLGPPDAESRVAGGLCSCATDSDWCESGSECRRTGCRIDPDSCGTFWAFDCNGHCFRT
jgi:hypothetical protein